MRTVQSEHDPFLRDFWREESARLYWETSIRCKVPVLTGLFPLGLLFVTALS